MNKNNQMILTEKDIVHAWLKDIEIGDAVFKDVEPINIYIEWCDRHDINEKIIARVEDTGPNYDERCTMNWHMPDNYKNINVGLELNERLKELGYDNDSKQFQRVDMEYKLFEKRGMVPVLQFLIYLVDVCKKHNIVLGVGRGSSVASYCLYLLGVHRVDSIKYELDIEEFLK